jgi:hypothetical protein
VRSTILILLAACATSPEPDEPLPSADSKTSFPNDKAAFDFFIGKGLKNFQAAGIVGNLDQESGVSPTSVEQGGPGRGIAQWSVGDRWDTAPNDNVRSFAAKQGASMTSLTLQLEFIWYELTAIGYGFSDLKATTNVTDATVVFMKKFEICGNCVETQRIAYAKAVLAAYGNDTAGGGDTPPEVDDFDGDGSPDAVLYRPSNQTWYVRFSSDATVHAFGFGAAAAVPLLGGDFDRDGRPDAVYVDTGNYTWHVRFSKDGTAHAFSFGTGGDVPLLHGDFDKDGSPDAVLYRPSNQTWYIRASATGTVRSFQFGAAAAVPLLGGDFDGDGQPDAVYVDKSNYTWHVRFSKDGSAHSFAFGAGGDVPLLGGDFDGDGDPDAVLYRPSNQTWYVRSSKTAAVRSFQFGAANAEPLLGGDFDGDSQPDAIYVDKSNYTWHVRFSKDGATHAFGFGTGGDVAVH